METDKKQGGYTLLITLVLVILFSVLGLSLMGLTSGGIIKNEKREDITRAADLSDKGIDLISKKINFELTEALGDNGLPRGQFIAKLNSILKDYECSSINNLNQEKNNTNTGKYDVCIKLIEKTYDDKGEENELRKLVTFTSTGESGSADRLLISKIEIGAETSPETMKYAIGTNIMSKNPKNGEGNLLIHGGIDIQGDLKVDGNIVTRDHGYAYLGGERWIGSLYPGAKPTVGAKSSKLVLGNKAYTFSNNPTYSTHINTQNFTSNNYKNHTKDNVSNLFRLGQAPKIVTREPIVSPIGIESNKELYKYSRNSPSITVLQTGTNREIQNQNSPNLKVFPTYFSTQRICVEWNWWGRCTKEENQTAYDDSGTFEIMGKNTFKNFSTLGSLAIKQNNTDISFKEGLYVEGDLIIGNTSAGQNTNINNYSNISLDGPIFVNGKVIIRGANLKSNVLIYVNSSSDAAVDIQYSTMNGKELTDGKSGSFIIFSKGNIKISNNSVDQDEPSNIKGFFYSEQDLEMFGVGSNIRIEGGISARRIVLNAIRGRASGSSRVIPNHQSVGGSYFESVSGQKDRDSRLTIIYDPEIIATYSDLKQQEPVIYKVDPPLEKDRSF